MLLDLDLQKDKDLQIIKKAKFQDLDNILFNIDPNHLVALYNKGTEVH